MSDDVDPSAATGQRRQCPRCGTRPSDREWQRLRRVEAAAKELVEAWDQAETSEPELEALRLALWPEEGEE